MTDISDEAKDAALAHSGVYGMMGAKDAYPIIRRDVASEIVAALRDRASTLLPEDRTPIKMAADFIEREFGGGKGY